jgi:hypothetical protein
MKEIKKGIESKWAPAAPGAGIVRVVLTACFFALWLGGSLFVLSGCQSEGAKPNPGDAVTDGLDEPTRNPLVEKLQGQLAYFIPDTMTVRQDYRVGMQIAGDTSRAVLEEMIASYPVFSDNEQDVQSEQIRIGPVMRAVLVDPSPEGDKKFAITPFGESDRRRIDLRGGEPALWEWVVTPLQKGDHKLYFSIEVIVEGEGGQTPKVIPVKEADIQVVVEPGFFQEYAGLIGAVLISLLGGGLVLFWLRRRQEAQMIQQLPLAEVRTLVGDGRLPEAVDLLESSFQIKMGKPYRQVMLLKARLENHEEKSRKGILDNDEITRERNRITDDLLALLDGYGRDGSR